eukprot:6602891-Lingulodinium_polyedra.AAC.1
MATLVPESQRLSLRRNAVGQQVLVCRLTGEQAVLPQGAWQLSFDSDGDGLLSESAMSLKEWCGGILTVLRPFACEDG